MSGWYRQGIHWINHGLPMYVAIDASLRMGVKSRMVHVDVVE